MFDTEPDRWAGLFIAVGVLLPAGLWFVHDRLSPRVRRLLTVVAGLLLVAAAGLALSRTSLIGYLLGFGGDFSDSGEDDRRATFVLLATLGLALGLALAIGLRTRDPEPVTVVEDEPPVEEEPVTGTTEVLGTPEDTKSAYWSSHVVDAPPKGVPAVPVGAAPLALLVAALALGLPVLQIGLDSPTVSALFAMPEVTFMGGLALLLQGLAIGLALLLPALAVRGRDAWAVYAAYGFVAVGQGLVQSFADTFGNEYWFAFGIGAVAGLLLPTMLRFVGGIVTEDRAALAGGILVVVGLLVATTYFQSKAARDSLEDTFSSGFSDDDDDDDDDDGRTVPAEPTFVFPTEAPEPTFTFPSDFPTGFPTDFPEPTFTFPSGFPTAFLTPTP